MVAPKSRGLAFPFAFPGGLNTFRTRELGNAVQVTRRLHLYLIFKQWNRNRTLNAFSVSTQIES